MPKTATINIRVDPVTKSTAEKLFASFGITITDAVNMFLHKSIMEGGLPFELRQERPNKETIAAMLEAERISHDPSVKEYDDLDELFAELRS